MQMTDTQAAASLLMISADAASLSMQQQQGCRHSWNSNTRRGKVATYALTRVNMRCMLGVHTRPPCACPLGMAAAGGTPTPPAE